MLSEQVQQPTLSQSANNCGAGSNSSIGKILVVDDEPELRAALVEALAAQGYETLGCSSGHKALEELRAHNCDLLLTDLMMPEMDGIALLEEALHIDPHLICIMMTGQGTIQTAVDAMKLGAFDYVLKPFRMQTIMPVLTRAVNMRHLRLENLQLRETIAIYGLSQTIAFTLDPQTVISKLADAALQQTDADEVSILLPTSDGKELYVAAVRGENRERLLGEKVTLEESISGWVAREREPLILEGEVNDKRFRSLWPHPEIRSSISIPMQVANKLVGTININALSRPRPFTLGQMKALTILASTAAAALESASLYGQVRHAEEKYRSIFENAIEGIFQATPEGRFITVNPAMARILGYDSPEEVIEKITDVVHQLYVCPEARLEAAQLQERFGFVQGFEFEAYRKDGEKIWLSLNRRSVCDDNGAEICREGSIEDITKGKHAAEALRESEARKRAILESVLDCIVTMDHEGLVVDWNPAAERTFGYPREEAIGREMAELIIPPLLREHHRRGLANYLATGQGGILGKRLELSAVRADGAEFPVELTITRIESEGAPMFTGYIRDITERKRAGDRLAAQHSVTRSVAESSTLKEGTVKVLQAICESLGWEYGALWTVDRGLDGLRCKEVWQGPATEASKFEKVSRESVFAPGIGLPGKIWSEGQPLWIPDVVRDTNFPRALIAIEEGLHAACGFPIRLGSEVLGVMEFFSRSIREPDSALLEMMATIGSQIGQFIERKRAEEALRESEERYKGLIDSAFDGVVILRDRIIVSANRAYAEMLGYSVEELIGLDVLEFMAPEYKDLVLTQIAQTESTYESVGLRKDGTRIPIEISGQLCLYEGQTARLAAVRDMTGRRRVEETQARRSAHVLFRADVSAALAMSRAPLQPTLKSCATAMVEHLGAAFARIWTLNREEDVLELQASAGIYTHIDGPHSRVPVGSFKIGKIAQERAPHITNQVQIDPRVSDKEWARREGMVAFAGYPLMVEDRLLGVMALFSRDELPEDTLDALASVAALISQGIERKRAEEELRESEERYRLLFESNPQPMWVYDLETLAFLAVNQSAVRHYGYSREDFLAMTIKDIRPAEDIPALYDSVARSSEGVEAGIWRHLKKDGTIIEVEITSHFLVFDNRRAELILAHDITERHRLEAALLASEEQLRQSQKMEAVGQLAGGVAHDFNNLLTVIGGYSELLLRRLLPENPLRSSVEEIKKASDRAGGLTRQLLAFSRKQILQPKVLDLNTLVSDLDKLLRRLIGEDIDLLTITEPALGQVKVDPGQIEQVVLNVAVNARDAMPNGGQLTIQTSNVYLSEDYAKHHVAAVAGNYVMLSISDNGGGMDLATKDRIFEPFFTTKGAGKGTGLGLSTVYGIVKQSGGNIWVYSEVGKGTAFKIYLPRVDESRDKGFAQGDSSPAPLGTETILLVEDEEQVRRIAQEILEAQGYQVLVATNGEEALAFAQQYDGEIHLMITDVVMPQMGGREAVERLSSLRPDTRVLYMSGYTDDAIVRHGLMDEQLQFIEKPFTADALARKVRTVLDTKAG